MRYGYKAVDSTCYKFYGPNKQHGRVMPHTALSTPGARGEATPPPAAPPRSPHAPPAPRVRLISATPCSACAVVRGTANPTYKTTQLYCRSIDRW